ncbi:MAG: hypothetical protein DME26_09415, partial [Verrucomicrobia bacterium]
MALSAAEVAALDRTPLDPPPTQVPAVRLDASNFDFGTVLVGQSADVTLTISNTGTAPLTIQSMCSFVGGFNAAAPSTPFTIPAGGRQAVTLRFTPVFGKAWSGTLSIFSNDPRNPLTTVGLTGIANSCPPITLSPATLPDGNVNTVYNQTITVSGGTEPYVFTLSSSALPNGLTLTSAGTLTGTPSTTGDFMFTIRATDANNCSGDQSYTLRVVQPTLPNIEVGLGAMNFGTVTIFQDRALPLTLRNTGPGTLVINSLVVASSSFLGDYNAFVVPAGPITLAAGAEEQVTLRFAPTAWGWHRGTLTINSNDPDQPTARVLLYGLGWLAETETGGSLVAWGANGNGQLGIGTSIDAPVPVNVSGGLLAGKTIVAVAGGQRHTLALSSDDRLFAWGDNSS